MKTAVVALVTLIVVAGLAGQTAQEPAGQAVETPAPAPLPAIDTTPYRAQVAQLEQQLFARDNEILHLRTEWATCRASLDAADLTTQAFELVRRCEAATGGKCTWDDKQRRVVKVDAPKEPSR